MRRPYGFPPGRLMLLMPFDMVRFQVTTGNPPMSDYGAQSRRSHGRAEVAASGQGSFAYFRSYIGCWALVAVASVLGMTRRSHSPTRCPAHRFAPGRLPDDLCSYADTLPPRRRQRPPPTPALMPVTDNWPEYIPVTAAEIAVFEAWFGDILEELIQGE